MGEHFPLSSLDTITPEPFSLDMIPAIKRMNCGSTPFGLAAMEWICADPMIFHNVKREINRGTRVWLYRNRAGERIGFGSLGTHHWIIRGVRTPIQYIPMIGVFMDFQGKPPPPSVKYCYQIIDHLLDEAEAGKGDRPIVGLSVAADNLKAVHIYTASGFTWLPAQKNPHQMFVMLS